MSVHLVARGEGPWIRFGRVTPFAAHCEFAGEPFDGPFAAAKISCQKGRRPGHGLDCIMCRRFRGFTESRHQTRVRCEWSDEDPVAARMTLGTALITVAPDTPVEAADELARRHEIRHLPVLDRAKLVGILCRCDLVAPPRSGETVAERMSTDIFAVPPRATLGEALSAMVSLRVGCLLVVGDGMLLGILTRGDLRRVGVPEALLGAGHCTACGSPHGVRTALDGSDVEYCLDCLQSDAPVDLGVGD
jgi:predicted transcriptional regulator